MVFFVKIAANVSGGNHNIRLRFPSRPALRELSGAAELYFGTQPPQSFRLDAMMLFDEYTFTWVELYSAAQLSTDCQVYVFYTHGKEKAGEREGGEEKQVKKKKKNRNEKNEGSIIPSPNITMICATPPRPLLSSRSDARMQSDGLLCPAQCQSCSSSGPRRVFNALDSDKKGYLLYSDLRRAVDEQQGVYGDYATSARSALADKDGNDRISYKEWVRFSASQPTVVETLFNSVASGCGQHAKNMCGGDRSARTSCMSAVGAYERSWAVLKHEEARLAADALRLDALRGAWERSKRRGRSPTAGGTCHSWRVCSLPLY